MEECDLKRAARKTGNVVLGTLFGMRQRGFDTRLPCRKDSFTAEVIPKKLKDLQELVRKKIG